MRPLVVITVAGADSSAGAGIQADLKTFTHFGVYGHTIVTCVVAEIPGEVASIQAIDESVIEDQLRLSLENFPVVAIKTGLLYSGRIIDTICSAIENIDPKPALVVDPVIIASSGDRLLLPGAIDRYQKRLIPLASLVTPNLDEAVVLLGRPIQSLGEMREAAETLFKRFGVPFLIKGGHLCAGSKVNLSEAIDILIDGRGVHQFSAPYHRGIQTHGTGCTYSAAITANLAMGLDLRSAVDLSKQYVTRAITESFQWESKGRKISALRHSWGRES